MSEISEYYDNFLEHLKKDHERENPRHVHIKKRIDQLVHSGQRVLDFGCGTGITTKHIAQRGGIVTGIDISQELIDFAEMESSDFNASYVCIDIYHSDEIFRENYSDYFDIAFMNDVLEHIPEIDAFEYIDEISRSLKKDGIFYVNIPYGPYQHFIGDNYPQLQQIVDETYYIEDLCTLFAKIKFVPTLINIYGLDTECQYLEAVFSRTSNIFNYYKEKFNGKQYKANRGS